MDPPRSREGTELSHANHLHTEHPAPQSKSGLAAYLNTVKSIHPFHAVDLQTIERVSSEDSLQWRKCRRWLSLVYVSQHNLDAILREADHSQAGRIGGPVVDELANAGFDVTVLTRDPAHVQGKSSNARTVQVDYDSDSSLAEALKGQDALVSTVAMSAIGNQKRMIDVAINAGVKYYIPAEYTVNSRAPNAQAQPMMASVVQIQKVLEARGDKIAWFVVNCGALLEFVLDHPVLLDFNNQQATLWDGGDGAISLSDIPLLARAVAAALQKPEKVVDHRLRVHGGSITQNRALELAQQHSQQTWKVNHAQSQPAYTSAMEQVMSGATGDQGELMKALMTAYNAATFGTCDGHFESAYVNPDNGWLGVDTFRKNEIEEAIRRRVTVGTYAAQSATADQESLGDVTRDIAAAFQKS